MGPKLDFLFNTVSIPYAACTDHDGRDIDGTCVRSPLPAPALSAVLINYARCWSVTRYCYPLRLVVSIAGARLRCPLHLCPFYWWPIYTLDALYICSALQRPKFCIHGTHPPLRHCAHYIAIGPAHYHDAYKCWCTMLTIYRLDALYICSSTASYLQAITVLITADALCLRSTLFVLCTIYSANEPLTSLCALYRYRLCSLSRCL